MTPPPPLFRFTRDKDDVAFDPALGDEELIAVRSALQQGRWAEVRALLARTGEDWDSRGHRLVVLAEGKSTAAWAQEWRIAEPESPDAAALTGCAAVFRAMLGKQTPHSAREACLRAARMTPGDPTPWLGLLILARRTGTDEEQVRAFDQVRGRHRGHHHAHHLMIQCLAERQKTDGDDPFHEVYEFAEWAAAEAGPVRDHECAARHAGEREAPRELETPLELVDDERLRLEPGEKPEIRSVRFRTLGCYPLTGAVESRATTVPEIIAENEAARTSERHGRAIDADGASSMERKKQEGYF